MAKIHTHYDNLKVTRNAPQEIIRAAYKTLSQKFHPDRNPGNADAARIMSIINASHHVLSDPGRRHAYNQWLAQQELMAAQATTVNDQPSPPPRPRPPPRPATRPTPASSPIKKNVDGILLHAIRYRVLYISILILGFFVWAGTTATPSTLQAGLKPYQAEPTPVQPEQEYAEPTNSDAAARGENAELTPAQKADYAKPSGTGAPNGQPWPTSAGYVKGYKRLHTKGLSTVTVDNSRNDSDVFVKLVSLDGAEAYPVRQFYIPAFGKFTVKKVTAGSYDIRYRDLSNGGLSRAEAFNLKEKETQNGTQFSNISMTLYKVENGNMQTYGLSEAEF